MGVKCFKKAISAYLWTTTICIIVVLALIGYDVFHYFISGQFNLLPSLNVVPLSTVEEAWEYAETLSTWGESEWMQMLVYYVFRIGIFNTFWSFLAKTTKLLKSKSLFLCIIISFISLMVLYLAYRWFIWGCVSEPYIRRVIL